MNATLNIYADCTSDQPTKTYVCRRLLYKVAKKVSALVEGFDKLTAEEQEQANIDICKALFPDFQDEDFGGIDTREWIDFVNEIGRGTNQVLENAQKNL